MNGKPRNRRTANVNPSQENAADRRKPEQRVGDKQDRPSEWKSLARDLVFVFFLMLIVRSLVVHSYWVPSSSMEGTLLINDFLLANRFVYGAPVEIPFTGIVLGRLPGLTTPQRGDIVIFTSWHDTSLDFIKRCVGVPGDTILVRNDVLYVNGRNFDEILRERFGRDPATYPIVKTYPHQPTFVGGFDPANYPPDDAGHVVPPGHYFMMGDNRDNSADSRYPGNGDVPFESIKARATIIYFSVDSSHSPWNLLEFVRWSRIGRLLH